MKGAPLKKNRRKRACPTRRIRMVWKLSSGTKSMAPPNVIRIPSMSAGRPKSDGVRVDPPELPQLPLFGPRTVVQFQWNPPGKLRLKGNPVSPAVVGAQSPASVGMDDPPPKYWDAPPANPGALPRSGVRRTQSVLTLFHI